MRIAICPGSFDPITVGHLDLVRRAAKLFDRVVVCVMVNGEKHPMFSVEERAAMVERAIADIPNAGTAFWDGLLVDFAAEQGACAIVKGARSGIDFEGEYQLACVNRQLAPQLETVLLPADQRLAHISSTVVRDLIRHERDISSFVPAGVAGMITKTGEKKGQ